MFGVVSGGRLRARGLACAALACATAAVHTAMDTGSAAASGRLAVPSPARAKALALGFEPVVADWFWIQAIQLVGGAVRSAGDPQLVGELIDVVTALDPWVDHPYRFAALWLTEDRDAVLHANRLLRQGIAYHPLDWRNRFYLGYNHFFHLDEPAAAADVLEPAVALEGAPAYLGAFVTRLRAASDSLDTAALFLEQLVRETEDEYARAEYLKAFDEIEIERRARHLDRARDEFRRRHGRDLRAPAELWSGPLRVLDRQPPPHPHFDGFEWVIDAESGEIVSSFYGTRYRIHVHPADAARKREQPGGAGESEARS